MKFLNRFKDDIYSLLRLMTGLLFLQHGTTKYLSFPVTKYSGVDPTSLIGMAGMIELVGGGAGRGRPVHPAGGIPLLRLHGRRLFPRTFSAELLPDPELGRAQCAVLLRVLLHRGGGRREMEHRRHAQERRLTLPPAAFA